VTIIDPLAPAWIRLKARAIAFAERAQPLEDGGDAARSRMAERTTSKRRETRTEDERRVDQVGIRDDLLAQTGDALVE